MGCCSVDAAGCGSLTTAVGVRVGVCAVEEHFSAMHLSHSAPSGIKSAQQVEHTVHVFDGWHWCLGDGVGTEVPP